MAYVSSPSHDVTNYPLPNRMPIVIVGPMLENGGAYSAIGFRDLCGTAPSLLPLWTGQLEPLSLDFRSCAFWKYGTGSHSSEARSILGSIVLEATAPDATALRIRHLVFDGGSQWVVGRNHGSIKLHPSR